MHVPDDGAISRRVTLLGGEDMSGARHALPPRRYRICARGRLGQAIRSVLPVLQARASGAGCECCSAP
jgi:hypothetical protein